MLRVGSKILGAMTGAALGLTLQAAMAQTQTASLSAAVRGDSTAPAGWSQFCEASPADCDVSDLPSRIVTLDEARWRELLRVNARVNREVEPVTDLDNWGVLERWSYPTDGRGDCEDYVLEKRRRLMELGWPRQALLITVVRDKKGDGHAVLMVRTDRGDFILDNQESFVLLWAQTGYRFHKRQSAENPNRWVSLGAIDTRFLVASR